MSPQPAFVVNDRVVYPSFGVGRVAAVVSKSFYEAETMLYYEVQGDQSTVWVSVDEAVARGLRRLTHPDELAELRGVLRGRPEAMHSDFRQRQRDVRARLKPGTLAALCGVVRDLSGLSWPRGLSGYDAEAFRKHTATLAQEWAAAGSTSVAEATAEVNGLLGEARLAYRV